MASFLEDLRLTSTSVPRKCYILFGLEPPHKLHLVKSKQQKDFTFMLLGSDRAMAKSGAILEQRQSLKQIRVSILCGVKFLLAATDREAGILGLHVNVSSKGCFVQWNGLFPNGDVRTMLEGKY